MTVHERVFEKWLAEGGDLTFGEWREERKARAIRYRQQASTHAALYAAMQQTPPEVLLAQQQRLGVLQQQYAGPRMAQGVGGILGGLLGRGF